MLNPLSRHSERSQQAAAVPRPTVKQVLVVQHVLLIADLSLDDQDYLF